MKKRKAPSYNLPAAVLMLVLLMLWQAGAMKLDAAYIVTSQIQIVE